MKIQRSKAKGEREKIPGRSRWIFLKFHFFLLTYCLLVLPSCNDSFQPFQENDVYYFSIFGYLDAAADTQWVRVGTVRQHINEPPDPKGIRVTLEVLESGETVVMNDSLFASKGFLNYWTTMNIENEQTYRITAEHSDGKTSRVTVTTPKEIPSTYITNSQNPDGANIYIDIKDEFEHIADVQSVWYVILNPETENRRRIYRFSDKEHS